jgi:hypothetical protein
MWPLYPKCQLLQNRQGELLADRRSRTVRSWEREMAASVLSGFPSAPNATSGGTRSSSPCRPDPVPDVRRSPTSTRRTPSGSPPSIFRSQRAPRSCGYTDRGERRWQPRLLAFGRLYLARSFKCARDFNTEVAQDRRGRVRRVVVEENVVASVRSPSWVPDPRLPKPQLSVSADTLIIDGRDCVVREWRGMGEVA